MNTVDKIHIYRIAVDLFNNYYSYPQVVELIMNENNVLKVDEVKHIVDLAMTDTFDKAANHAMKLISENSYTKVDIVNSLTNTYRIDADIADYFVSNLIYNKLDIETDLEEIEYDYNRVWYVFGGIYFVLAIINRLYFKINSYFFHITFFIILIITFIVLFKKKSIVKRMKQNVDLEIIMKFKLMNRFENLFRVKSQNVLNIYCTAGFPKLDDTVKVMKALEKYGANIIELGMPYSDPVADGDAIQKSDDAALKNGMTVKTLFQQLRTMREYVSVPVVLMGYLNPVLQYGFENFCAKAAEVGVDGLIIPDLPAFEFENEYGEIVRKYGLDFIFLVTPETSDERIKKLDVLSSGFLYAVTSSSTTGGDKDFQVVGAYLERLKNLQLKNPVLAGFGVKDKTTFNAVCQYANGAIIGSAYIKALQKNDQVELATEEFLNSVLA